MVLFFLSCLTLFVAAFFIMIAVHVMKIEKTIVEAAERIEEKVTRLYSEGVG